MTPTLRKALDGLEEQAAKELLCELNTRKIVEQIKESIMSEFNEYVLGDDFREGLRDGFQDSETGYDVGAELAKALMANLSEIKLEMKL